MARGNWGKGSGVGVGRVCWVLRLGVGGGEVGSYERGRRGTGDREVEERRREGWREEEGRSRVGVGEVVGGTG